MMADAENVGNSVFSHLRHYLEDKASLFPVRELVQGYFLDRLNDLGQNNLMLLLRLLLTFKAFEEMFSIGAIRAYSHINKKRQRTERVKPS